MFKLTPAMQIKGVTSLGRLNIEDINKPQIAMHKNMTKSSAVTLLLRDAVPSNESIVDFCSLLERLRASVSIATPAKRHINDSLVAYGCSIENDKAFKSSKIGCV